MGKAGATLVQAGCQKRRSWTGAKNTNYQLALSFAGEQRDYVEEVARYLEKRSVAVFYDGFEKVFLWGRNGTEAFHEAFAQQTAYVVMFISKAYEHASIQRGLPRYLSQAGGRILRSRSAICSVRSSSIPSTSAAVSSAICFRARRTIELDSFGSRAIASSFSSRARL